MNKEIKYFLTNWKQICAPSQPLSHGLPDLPLFCLRGNRVLSPWISSFNSFHLMNNGRQPTVTESARRVVQLFESANLIANTLY